MTKVVIDTCSLVDLFKFFQDMNNFDDLLSFLSFEISDGELIIIDKVFTELESWRTSYPKLNDLIIESRDVINTDHLIPVISEKISSTDDSKWYIKENEEHFGFSTDRIEFEKEEFTTRHADGFLIAYCLENDDVVLITDETTKTRGYLKLFQKIPLICRHEGVKCKDLSYLLYVIFRNKIKISFEQL